MFFLTHLKLRGSSSRSGLLLHVVFCPLVGMGEVEAHFSSAGLFAWRFPVAEDCATQVLFPGLEAKEL